jgi:hypothetical protein
MELEKVVIGVLGLGISTLLVLGLSDIIKVTFKDRSYIRRLNQPEGKGNYRLSREENQGNNNYNPNR